ncbi:MAG: dethiobiotin synthase [Bacillota bacterium]
MRQGIFITGTDTGAGKTVVTAGLLAAFRKSGINAIAVKPVQSGALKKEDGLVSPDAAFYLAASKMEGSWCNYNPYCFEPPLSPHLAAELCGVTINPELILSKCRSLQARHDIVLVEGAGGICVPITRSGYMVSDLAKELGFPVIIVAKPGLGTINHTVLTIKYAQSAELEVAGFIFNNIEGKEFFEESDNAKVITALTGVPQLGSLPYLDDIDVERGVSGSLAEAALTYLSWRKIGGLV